MGWWDRGTELSASRLRLPLPAGSGFVATERELEAPVGTDSEKPIAGSWKLAAVGGPDSGKRYARSGSAKRGSGKLSALSHSNLIV